MRVTGWLLDAYPVRSGMAVWIVADDGRRLSALERWRPSAYLGADRIGAERVRAWVERQNVSAKTFPARGKELKCHREREVFRLEVGDAENFTRLMGGAIKRFPEIEFFNSDIPPDRLWFFVTRRFPLARVEADIEDGELRFLNCLDSIWDTDYPQPPLGVMGLRLEGPALNPAHGFKGRRLEVHVGEAGEEVRVLDGDDPGALVRRLNDLLNDHDPDLLVTEYGDSFVLPRLAGLAARFCLPLKLNRDPSRPPLVTASRSFFTYGRIVHRDGSFILFGRLHLDKRNSFTLEHTGFEGVFENARLSRLPVQTAARATTGTGISCMQLAQAIHDGILVPVEKSETEDFKSAAELLQVDKGGLVFQPETGVYERVGELDFASMYPTIMVRHNLSPETFDCPCCREDGEEVPESGLKVCRRRPGLVPRTLEPLLIKRAKYKRMRREAPTAAARSSAKERADAHKWLLVCSFGYLGYHNARFGKIEAHEATTAWGREALLTAKETAEEAGFTMLHGIVDCLWVRRKGETSRAEYEGLARSIEVNTGLPVTFEGEYRWLAFLPSKEDSRRAVAQRYLGVFANGEVKVRCLELRRADTAPVVADLQSGLVTELAGADSVREARRIARSLVERVQEAIVRIRGGRARPAELAMRCALSKSPGEYTSPTPGAIAAGQLVSRGARLEQGEVVSYVFGYDQPYAFQVYPDGWPYDAEKYADYALKAAAAVLEPFGIDAERLREACEMPARRPRLAQYNKNDGQMEFWTASHPCRAGRLRRRSEFDRIRTGKENTHAP